MTGTIVLIGIFIALAAGLWITRGAKGPSGTEIRLKNAEQEGKISPMGEPMRFDNDLDPPPDY